jgi:hypothetical protein
MNRVWAFTGNAALIFGGLGIALEIVLGHDPVTIVQRACLCVLGVGLAAFVFRWLLERWFLAAQVAKVEQAKPEVAKTNAAAAKSAVKVGRG